MKKLLIILAVLFFTVTAWADSALQVDFLLSGYNHPTSDQPLSGGKVYTYLDGTSTLSAVWTDKDKGGFATNPVILDSSGKAEIFGDNIYKIEIYDSNDVLIEILNGLEYRATSSRTDVLSTYGCNLETAIATIGSVNQTHLIIDCKPSDLTGNFTVPENITIEWRNGYTLGGAFNFAMSGVLIADRYQLFDGPTITLLNGALFPEWWGENTTPGTTDMTTEIQAAIDCAENSGGEIVSLDNSTYFVSSTLTIDGDGVNIQGSSKEKTIITRSGSYGDTFFFTGNDVTGIVLEDVAIGALTITSTGLMGSGAHIDFNGATRVTVDNIFMLNGFTGIIGDALTAATINDLYLVFTNIYGGSTNGRAYLEFGSAAATYAHPSSGDVFVSNFNVRGNSSNNVTAYGINIESADGIWFSNGHVGNTADSDLLLNAIDTETINLVFFDNVMFDACLGFGVQFAGSTTLGRVIQFNNCVIKGGGTGTTGVYTSSTTTFTGVQFTGCTITEFIQRGMWLQSADFEKATFTNLQVRGNSWPATKIYPVITVDSGNSFQFIGGQSGSNNVNDTVTQEVGIDIDLLAENIVISSMDLRFNDFASITVDAALRDTVKVTNCIIGDSITIPSASTINIPVGLDFIQVQAPAVDIENIQPSYTGHVVTIRALSGGPFTFKNAVGNLVLAGSDFVATTNDVLTLVYNNSTWLEVSRSVN